MFIGEERAGSTEPGLDFIEHEQNVVLIADLATFAQVPIRRENHAALTLNRFGEKADRILVDRLLEGLRVIVRYHLESGRKRSKSLAILSL